MVKVNWEAAFSDAMYWKSLRKHGRFVRFLDFRNSACRFSAAIAFLGTGRNGNNEEHSQIPICNVDGGAALTAADYKVLEEDPDGDGFPTYAEYIAFTDPNDAASRFNATISIDVDGTPVVGWNTQTSPSRTYKVFGKVDLSDSVWLEVKDNVELYRFFRVTVEVK